MTATATLNEADRLSVNQLARRENVHVATVWRWMLSGVRGIKLRWIYKGGRRYITETDWQAFSDALNADLADTPANSTPAAVTARAERAGHQLNALLGNCDSRSHSPAKS